MDIINTACVLLYIHWSVDIQNEVSISKLNLWQPKFSIIFWISKYAYLDIHYSIIGYSGIISVIQKSSYVFGYPKIELCISMIIYAFYHSKYFQDMISTFLFVISSIHLWIIKNKLWISKMTLRTSIISLWILKNKYSKIKLVYP